MSYDLNAPSSSTGTRSGWNVNVDDAGFSQSVEWSTDVEMDDGGSNENVNGGGRWKRFRDHAQDEQDAASTRSVKRRRGAAQVATRSSARIREQRQRDRRPKLSVRQQQQQQQQQQEQQHQQQLHEEQQEQRLQRYQQRMLRRQQEQEAQAQAEAAAEAEAQAQAEAQTQAQSEAPALTEMLAIAQALEQTEPFQSYHQRQQWLGLFRQAQQQRLEEQQQFNVQQLQQRERDLTANVVARRNWEEALLGQRLQERLRGEEDDILPATILTHLEIIIPLLEEEVEQLQPVLGIGPHMPAITFSDIDPQAANVAGDCSICLSGFLPEETVCMLQCNHIFHQDCIREWTSSGGRTCPNCRAVMASAGGQDA